MHHPDNYRIRKGAMASNSSYGNNGAFAIPLSGRSTAFIIASDGEGWEHVSVHVVSEGKQRTPTWAEMCKIKDLFWSEEETVIQYHPPKSEYVNNHKHCLHLWKKIGFDFPLPDSIMVGIKANQ
jgi:hypothetical protein